MDITHLFKAGVMTVKLHRKSEVAPQAPDKNRILARKGAAGLRDDFAKQAKEVCHKITSLRNVLLENRSAYMRIGQHLKKATHMTDQQRDLIDRESEKFVTHYTQLLAQMRDEWKRAKRKPQQHQHIDAVLDLLTNYLRSVQQIYLEQKKYRAQHELETYRLLKLAADKKKIPVRPAGERSGKRPKVSSRGSESDTDESDENSSDMASTIGREKKEKGVQQSPTMKLKKNHATLDKSSNSSAVMACPTEAKAPLQSSQEVALDEDMQKSQQLVDEEEKLSPEDVQMFEQENVQLYHELQGLAEEVELIEKNVVDIAQLQDIFTEKVSLQQHNIERIANAVVGATENVKDANEQIKQAIQRNAGLRVWSLFFLLVMSFALLFLDWYYD